jgi:hypothetical protein
MLVRLTKKLAEVVNGLDLSQCAEGDLLDLPERDAKMLLAEGWAEATAQLTFPDREGIWRPDARQEAADSRRPHSPLATDDELIDRLRVSSASWRKRNGTVPQAAK